MVSISACHAEDPGSIPGRGVFFAFLPHAGWRSYRNLGSLAISRAFLSVVGPARIAEETNSKSTGSCSQGFEPQSDSSVLSPDAKGLIAQLVRANG